MRVRMSLAAVAVATVLGSGSVYAQEGPQTVRVVVREDVKSAGTPLTKDTINLKVGGHDVPVQGLRPLMQNGATPVEVAVLIDDGLRGSFSNQISDIRSFVQGLSTAGASVAVGYMQNGRVLFASNAFSRDPDTATQALRLPMAGAGINGSPYFCLQDALKRWPSRSGAQRIVLMITNGIDAYNGPAVPQNQDSPYVQTAIRDAQRAGVPVYSIYYGRFDVHQGFGSFSGQSYLGQVADETGAETFNQGSLNPPSIAPFLKDFDRDLHESYLLTFQAGSKNDMEQLKIKSTAGAKLHVQQQVAITSTR